MSIPPLLPQSLLARTVVVILLALVASQFVSLALFRQHTREPRVQLVVAGFVGQLKIIRAALETLPPEQQREFVQRLRDDRGMRIFRVRDDEPMEVAPDIPALRAARERLREEFGADAEIFVRTRPQKPDAPPLLVTRVPIREASFYVVFPRNRVVEPDYTWAWVGWGVFGGMVALAGAVFLMWRVNRPLKLLAAAARELGQGQTPAPVREVGPAEVRSLASAFNQMREDLVRRDHERATFLAGVSHDLRTPLARLRLGVEMLPADRTTRADLEHDIDDINGIIDQFMDFARDESVEVLQTADLNRIVQEVVDRDTRTLPEGAHLAFTPAPLAAIAMRPLAMKRLVGNLIDNALKHAGGDVSVETGQDADATWLRVLDRGEGIALHEVERLKQPFVRLDSSRAGASGAGLGLAIVERIAKLHGAAFSLLPRPGGGTIAECRIPRWNA